MFQLVQYGQDVGDTGAGLRIGFHTVGIQCTRRDLSFMTDTRVNILLAEDNEDDVVLIQEVFGSSELHIVSVVSDGEEVLAYLRQQGQYQGRSLPNLLILDINMPRKNGFEVIEAMKADPNFSSIPIVMLTMSEREEDINRSYASGACSYIRKPVDLDEFHNVAKLFELYWTVISRIPRKEV